MDKRSHRCVDRTWANPLPCSLLVRRIPLLVVKIGIWRTDGGKSMVLIHYQTYQVSLRSVARLNPPSYSHVRRFANIFQLLPSLRTHDPPLTFVRIQSLNNSMVPCHSISLVKPSFDRSSSFPNSHETMNSSSRPWKLTKTLPLLKPGKNSNHGNLNPSTSSSGVVVPPVIRILRGKTTIGERVIVQDCT